MPFLLFLAAFLSFSLPNTSHALECVAKMAPKINVIPTTKNVKYDYSKTKAQLNGFDIDTVSPYGPQHNTTVSGLMSGSIETHSEVEIYHEQYEQRGEGCVHIKSVNVTVGIDPTILIAKEYPKGTCYHNEIVRHEKKHVREDQLIVNKYVALIGKVLKAMVDNRTSFGPYTLDRLPYVQENVQNSIHKVVADYNHKLNLERQKRQQAIDTYEEYESIGANCPEKRR